MQIRSRKHVSRNVVITKALALIAALWSVSATASALLCTVVGVADGDTLTVLDGQQQIKVRMAEIDAPEKKQPFGARSKQSLSDMCFGKQAEIRAQARDRYGRTVARVTCAGVDANAEQVRRGLAWVYRQYARDKALYVLEDEARADRRGLWADSDPTPPWEWRRLKK